MQGLEKEIKTHSRYVWILIYWKLLNEDFGNDSEATSQLSLTHTAQSIHKVANGAGVRSSGVLTRYIPSFDQSFETKRAIIPCFTKLCWVLQTKEKKTSFIENNIKTALRFQNDFFLLEYETFSFHSDHTHLWKRFLNIDSFLGRRKNNIFKSHTHSILKSVISEFSKKEPSFSLTCFLALFYIV